MKLVHSATRFLMGLARNSITIRSKRSNDFFLDDLGEVSEDYYANALPRIQDLRCPKCHHQGSFKIQVEEFLLMFHDYLELDRTHETAWGSDSPCICPSCSFHGVVSQFGTRD
jgi:hypothetical protein